MSHPVSSASIVARFACAGFDAMMTPYGGEGKREERRDAGEWEEQGRKEGERLHLFIT